MSLCAAPSITKPNPVCYGHAPHPSLPVLKPIGGVFVSTPDRVVLSSTTLYQASPCRTLCFLGSVLCRPSPFRPTRQPAPDEPRGCRRPPSRAGIATCQHIHLVGAARKV